MKKIFLIGGGVIITILFVFTIVNLVVKKDNNNDLTKVTVAEVTHSVLYAPWYVALENGYFEKKQFIIFNIFQVLANLIAWGVVAPTLDILIYAEPVDKVYLQGFTASINNIVTIGILGSLLLASYAKTKIKTGSLKLED